MLYIPITMRHDAHEKAYMEHQYQVARQARRDAEARRLRAQRAQRKAK